MPHDPQHILVTGGAGFIGSNLLRHLLSARPAARLINLDLLTYAGSLENLQPAPAADRYLFVQGDICSRALVDDLLRTHEIDTIIHLAAESHVDRSISAPARFIETNITGTFTLLEAARDHWQGRDPARHRFHHVSTDEVFGSLGPDDPPFTESHPYAPNSPYSASKAASDHLVRAYHHTYHLPVTISNCSNNYGPRQHREKFIPTVISACLEERNIPVYGDGSNVRDWLFVDDHCEAIERIVCSGEVGATYNIGGDCERSNIAVARQICALMDELRPRGKSYQQLITFVTDRPGHDWRYAIDSSRAKRQLGWAPRQSFESGLRQTVNWYLDQWN